MSATFGSSASPWALARRSERNTSFGRRARCTSSLNVSEPNSSLALWGVEAVLRSDVPYSLMLRIATFEEAEPMMQSSFRNGRRAPRARQAFDYGRGAGAPPDQLPANLFLYTWQWETKKLPVLFRAA